MVNIFPNFFIFGALKCGAAALFDFFCKRPDIWLISRKFIAIKTEVFKLLQEFMEKPIETYREDIHQLESMIDRDLNHWLKIPQVKIREKLFIL